MPKRLSTEEIRDLLYLTLEELDDNVRAMRDEEDLLILSRFAAESRSLAINVDHYVDVLRSRLEEPSHAKA